ncbi:MAG: hypothetical protein AAEJ46_06940, partial [Planctomycetota bacterium]
MRSKTMRSLCWVLVVMMFGISSVWAARGKMEQAVPAELAEKVGEFEEKLDGQLQILKAQIEKAMPNIVEEKKTAYLKARDAELSAVAQLGAAQENLGKVGQADGLVGHAKGKWIGGADQGIAKAQEMLKKATTEAEREAAQLELVKWQENREAGVEALEERQAVLDRAKLEEPQWNKDLEAAENALVEAQANALEALDGLDLGDFLTSDKLDAKLAKYSLLSEATPRGLAEFAERGRKQKNLIAKVLRDDDLMIQMAVADGARDGKVGEAMQIYADIQKASRKAKRGVLQRLALAISLEHAVPIGQRNATDKTDAPATVDPVKRYLHYETAYLADELDPGFKELSVWDYRMVVNGEEPDETLIWGREMLRNYRPDHISTSDYRWRYVAAVRTEVKYGSGDNKYDLPELQFFQNILMNGGVCGRRAFFGRFILRSFGVPTTARPQRGHAALAHWTPDGWVVCLGGGWGAGWTKTRYQKDRDFLANTQAREVDEAFPQVKRAQWVGHVVGEKQVFGFLSGDPDFWHGVALYKQRQIIEEAKVVALAAVGTDIGEANESKVPETVKKATVTEEDSKITISRNGVITIPAVACSHPTNSTAKIAFMDSNLGGKQLHYGRLRGAEGFEYTFDAPTAGQYSLSARVVTPSWKQHLLVTANGAEEPIDIALPFTVGMWEETEPVEITLAKGKNILRFTHEGGKGTTIKDFTLKR